MRIAHTLLAAALAATATTATAAAQPMRDCRRFQTTATQLDETSAWARKLSVAGCLRHQVVTRRGVSDPELLRAMIDNMRAEVDRPIAIYREVMHGAPWELRLLAAYSLGNTYLEIIVRARAAIAHPMFPERDLDSAAASADLHAALEPLLEPYKLAAIEAFAQAETIADEIPAAVAVDDLVRNVVAGTSAALETIALE